MALTQDIMATYKGPGRVVARFLAQGRNEVRGLLFCLIAGMLMFVASAPIKRVKHSWIQMFRLQARIYWSAFLYILMMPI